MCLLTHHERCLKWISIPKALTMLTHTMYTKASNMPWERVHLWGPGPG